MAGIGFELKKLFQHTGVFASLRAFGYATVRIVYLPRVEELKKATDKLADFLKTYRQ